MNKDIEAVMKRFQDLNSGEKKSAVDHLYKRSLGNIKWNGAQQPDKIKARLKEITERIKFCGCTDCDIKLWNEIKKDSVITEFHLENATKEAGEAYYPEEKDIIVKV